MNSVNSDSLNLLCFDADDGLWKINRDSFVLIDFMWITTQNVTSLAGWDEQISETYREKLNPQDRT